MTVGIFVFLLVIFKKRKNVRSDLRSSNIKKPVLYKTEHNTVSSIGVESNPAYGSQNIDQYWQDTSQEGYEEVVQHFQEEYEEVVQHFGKFEDLHTSQGDDDKDDFDRESYFEDVKIEKTEPGFKNEPGPSKRKNDPNYVNNMAAFQRELKKKYPANKQKKEKTKLSPHMKEGPHYVNDLEALGKELRLELEKERETGIQYSEECPSDEDADGYTKYDPKQEVKVQSIDEENLHSKVDETIIYENSPILGGKVNRGKRVNSDISVGSENDSERLYVNDLAKLQREACLQGGIETGKSHIPHHPYVNDLPALMKSVIKDAGSKEESVGSEGSDDRGAKGGNSGSVSKDKRLYVNDLSRLLPSEYHS